MKKGVPGEEAKADARRDRLAIAQIVAANAIPVVGVWFLGWQPLRPIFFYWLDGLLAIWGLGVVAAVVTSRDDPKNFGEARANLFIHRTLVMGMLVFWGKWGHPPRWALAAYVLVVACLFTYTQLNPERYLRLIGFKTKHRSGKGTAVAKARRPKQTKGSGRSKSK